MSEGMTSNELIRNVQITSMIPVNQSTFTTEDFLQFATNELQLRLVTLVRSQHEDYFLFSHEVPLEENRFSYPIPSRASGNNLRDVQMKTSPNNYSEMTRIGIGDRIYNNSWSPTYMPVSGLQRFYVKNNNIVLVTNSLPNPAQTELCFIFYIRPSKLVPDDQVGIITGINRTTGEITLQNIPDDYTTSAKYDFYKGSSPYNMLKIDFSLLSVNTTTNTVTVDPDDIPVELEIGDHLPLAGEAIYPQIPCEFHPMLSQMTANRLMESLGDTEGLAAGMTKLAEMQQSLNMLIDDRVEDAPQKLVNRFSLTRLAALSKYWGY